MITAIETQIFALLQGLFDRFGWLGVSGLLAFEGATGFSSSELVLGLSGWLLLAAHDAPMLMVLVSGMYAALGSTLGASVTYWVVRLGGRPLVDRVVRRLRLNPEYVTRTEAQFQRWGPGLVFFGRLMPGVRILVNVPAGLVRMPYAQFFSFTFLGTYLWSTVMIGLGYLVGHQWTSLSEPFRQLTPWFVVSFLAMLALILVFRQLVAQRLHSSPLVFGKDEDE